MKNLLCVIILSFILILHLYLLTRQNRINRRVGAFSATMFTFMVYYEVIPILFYLQNEELLFDKELRIVNSSLTQFLWGELNILLFTFVFWITYIIFNKNDSRRKYIYSEYKMVNILRLFSSITFIIGGGSFFIYILQFGSLERLFFYAERLRAFNYSGTSILPYWASILIIPSRLIVVTPFLIITLNKIVERRNILHVLILIISIILSAIFIVFNAGKTDIILFLLCFAVPIFTNYCRHPWIWVIIAACFALPIVGLIDSFFTYISYGIWDESNTSLMKTLNQFAYPFLNVQYLSEIVSETGLRWGKDFITGFLNVIPGLSFDHSYSDLSLFFNGPYWQTHGGRPADIITFGYMEFSIIGTILMGVIHGYFCGKCDKLLKELKQESKKYEYIITVFLTGVFTYILNSDISGLVTSQLQYSIIIIILLYSCTKKKEI